jgi:hypothetical protein
MSVKLLIKETTLTRKSTRERNHIFVTEELHLRFGSKITRQDFTSLESLKA